MAAVKIQHKNYLQSTLRKKIINTLFGGLGRSVLGKTVPSVLSTALGLRPRAVCSRPLAQFFPIRTSRPANNIYVYTTQLLLARTNWLARGWLCQCIHLRASSVARNSILRYFFNLCRISTKTIIHLGGFQGGPAFDRIAIWKCWYLGRAEDPEKKTPRAE